MENKYEKLTNAVDLINFAFINNELSISLIKRDTEPFKGKYTIPGGFIHVTDRNFDDSISRVMKQKLLKDDLDIFIEQLRSEMDINRDPRFQVLSVIFATYSTDISSFKKDVEWFPVREIKDMDLGFDHNKLISETLSFLENCMYYRPTPLLVKEYFTLSDIIKINSDLKNVSENNFNRANYRKSNESLYIKTNKQKSVGAGRPSAVYTNKPINTSIIKKINIKFGD